MDKATVKLDGREYVIVARDEYDRLRGLARVADMPAVPPADGGGNFPAVEYARASIARSIVRARVKAGMSQKALARSAGVRVETLCRIERGRHTASVPTLSRIDRALQRAGARLPKGA